MGMVVIQPYILVSKLRKTKTKRRFGTSKMHLRRQRFGISKMHLSPPVAWAAVCSKAVVMLLLTFCLLLLPLWDSAIVLCFVVRNFISILVFQSS